MTGTILQPRTSPDRQKMFSDQMYQLLKRTLKETNKQCPRVSALLWFLIQLFFFPAGCLNWSETSDVGTMKWSLPFNDGGHECCCHTQLYHPLKEPVPLLVSALNLVMTHTLETLLRTPTLWHARLHFCSLCCWSKAGSQAEQPLCAVVILKWLRVGRLISHCGRWMILLLFCPG